MTYTPHEMRNIITEACQDLEESQFNEISDGFQSLMDYINLDTLVAWFYEIVCANEPHANMLYADQADAVEDWYNKHCR